jgi:hypothetical protein
VRHGICGGREYLLAADFRSNPAAAGIPSRSRRGHWAQAASRFFLCEPLPLVARRQSFLAGKYWFSAPLQESNVRERPKRALGRLTTTSPVGDCLRWLRQLQDNGFGTRPSNISYCLDTVRGPLFVTVPNSPREVMSVVPVNEVPLTVPLNVSCIDPPSGN